MSAIPNPFFIKTKINEPDRGSKVFDGFNFWYDLGDPKKDTHTRQYK
jgi:hypothetical protein